MSSQLLDEVAEQGEIAAKLYTDILIAELKRRDFIVLAKQEYEAMRDQAEAILERTDIPR